jgi:hypothetical protein
VVDVFDEVEEQLRSERYRTLAVKSLPWVAASSAGRGDRRRLVGLDLSYQHPPRPTRPRNSYQASAMTAQNRARRTRRSAVRGAVADGRQGLQVAGPDADGRHPPGQRTRPRPCLFRRGRQGRAESIMGDLARLKSAFALLDTAPYKELETSLTPLMGKRAPTACPGQGSPGLRQAAWPATPRRARRLRGPRQIRSTHPRRCA